jgi:hypothetical protein
VVFTPYKTAHRCSCRVLRKGAIVGVCNSNGVSIVLGKYVAVQYRTQLYLIYVQLVSVITAFVSNIIRAVDLVFILSVVDYTGGGGRPPDINHLGGDGKGGGERECL